MRNTGQLKRSLDVLRGSVRQAVAATRRATASAGTRGTRSVRVSRRINAVVKLNVGGEGSVETASSLQSAPIVQHGREQA